MPEIKRIDHIAILVDDMEAALIFWKDVLGLNLSAVVDYPNEQAKIAFIPTDNIEVELVKPTTEDSGLARFLEKRGPGMHHICLEVDDIEGMLSRIKSNGVELINEIPRIGDGGRKYAFIHPKSTFGVMIELYEYPGTE